MRLVQRMCVLCAGSRQRAFLSGAACVRCGGKPAQWHLSRALSFRFGRRCVACPLNGLATVVRQSPGLGAWLSP